ncbi:Putative amino acid transporter, transmembrane domain-containing protein [Septoria linicola]|uniref:Amino acid transporter, transmembrane domain-containing protein n=1 Tax=Septoria linicola TaxID=215465 RepID=A0A9Q9AS40_9PEZI|nr:putative amino acid transporter, transmembrane domain-containing protein [Septoria linicola]USW54409.1 Putative amino acid transporter, transmembrane domain-containing protein [Septoria linicola]
MFGDKKQQGDDLAPVPTSDLGYVDDYAGKPADTTPDDVFGTINEDGPNYKDVGWAGAAILMFKTQCGLGVLGIPGAFDVLGMIPGVIIILVIAFMTTWAAWMVGQFKLQHPGVYGIDDAGRLMAGRIGREFFFWAFVLHFTFLAASAMLSISIALNSLSVHGACTAIFVVVGALMGFLFGSIQTLGKVSFIAWAGVAGILTAIFTVTIAVGVQDRPAAAPQEGLYVSNYKIVGAPTFAEGISAVGTIVFAFSCLPAFFACHAEMRNPKHYTRSLCTAQGLLTVVYLIIGIVVYYYCGSYVASPALGSAGALMKRICYGIALPGLTASCMLFVHMPAKTIFMRFMRGTEHLTSNTPIHWMAWLGCTITITIVAYLIGSGIPVFDQLLSLVGALLATVTCFQPTGMMWLFDNFRRPERNLNWWAGVIFSLFMIIGGTFITIGGTYGAILGIVDSTDRTSPWSCADNSNSV